MMSRKPAALARIKDPHRTIEVACFLRVTLLRLMDGNLTLLDHQISALWRGARERVEETQATRLRRFRRLLGDLAGLADDETLAAAELRERLKRLITPSNRKDREAKAPFGRNSEASLRSWLGS